MSIDEDDEGSRSRTSGSRPRTLGEALTSTAGLTGKSVALSLTAKGLATKVISPNRLNGIGVERQTAKAASALAKAVSPKAKLGSHLAASHQARKAFATSITTPALSHGLRLSSDKYANLIVRPGALDDLLAKQNRISLHIREQDESLKESIRETHEALADRRRTAEAREMEMLELARKAAADAAEGRRLAQESRDIAAESLVEARRGNGISWRTFAWTMGVTVVLASAAIVATFLAAS